MRVMRDFAEMVPNEFVPAVMTFYKGFFKEIEQRPPCGFILNREIQRQFEMIYKTAFKAKCLENLIRWIDDRQ